MPQRTYLFSSNRKEKYLLNGFVQSQSLPRDENLRQAFSNHMIYQPDNLPPGVDMRPGMTRVEHQENTCSWWVELLIPLSIIFTILFLA